MSGGGLAFIHPELPTALKWYSEWAAGDGWHWWFRESVPADENGDFPRGNYPIRIEWDWDSETDRYAKNSAVLEALESEDLTE
jgi:hypothetical protein